MQHDMKVSGARLWTHDLWIWKRECYPLHHSAPLPERVTHSSTSHTFLFHISVRWHQKWYLTQKLTSRKESLTRLLAKDICFVFRLFDLINEIWHWKWRPTRVLAKHFFVTRSFQLRSKFWPWHPIWSSTRSSIRAQCFFVSRCRIRILTLEMTFGRL